MTTYRAERDGVVVFSAETDVYESTKVFPPECLNPTEGTVTLYVDDVIIGVQRPYAERAPEEAALAVEHAAAALAEAQRVADAAVAAAQETNR